MSASNTTKVAKDGNSANFNLTIAAESVSGNNANATYLKDAGTEALISSSNPLSVNIQSAIPAGSNTIGTVNATCSGSVTTSEVGAGSINPGQVSITTSATQIVAARTGAPGTGRMFLTIFNPGSSPIYIGGSGVTASTGYQVPAGSFVLQTTAAVYGILPSGAASQTVSYLEQY